MIMFLLWIDTTNSPTYQQPVDNNVHNFPSTRISHFSRSLIMWIKSTKIVLSWPHQT